MKVFVVTEVEDGYPSRVNVFVTINQWGAEDWCERLGSLGAKIEIWDKGEMTGSYFPNHPEDQSER